MSEKYALYEISYANALLYSRAVPMPDDGDTDDAPPLYDESKDANDPNKFTLDNDEEIVRI